MSLLTVTRDCFSFEVPGQTAAHAPAFYVFPAPFVNLVRGKPCQGRVVGAEGR
jgi:hypothetical protein